MKEYSEVIISAFAVYTRTVDLMKATGLSKATIVKYKKDTRLMELAEERRLQVVKESVYKMQSELTKCIDTLVALRDSPEVNPQVRVSACNSIMNHCRDFTLSVDVIERLEALERMEEDG